MSQTINRQTPKPAAGIRPRVAVIGAGWAGLAAAEALAHAADVTLFEAGRTLGGRARAVDSERSALDFIDNGQHLLVGAYHQCLALLRRAGVEEEAAFLRLPLTWYMADGMRFEAARWPAPWHLLVGIGRGQGMGAAEKWALLRQMRALQRWHRTHSEDVSVGQWLQKQGVSQKWQQQFWQPMVWASLNTPLAQASLARLAHVLADGVWQRREDSDMLIARQDLSRAWVLPVAQYVRRLGVQIQTHQRVGHVAVDELGHLWVDAAHFDRVVLAVAPYHAAALLPEGTPIQVVEALGRLRYHAITTVYLRYPQPVCLPRPITGLVEGTAQWLIDRGALGGDGQEVAAVISLSEQHGTLGSDDWLAKVHADVLRVCPHLPAPLAARVITEKRATIASMVGHEPIPQAWLRSQGIYVAGDYVHERYPATLEAAVQTAQAAAAACLFDWQQRPAMDVKRL